LAPERDQASLDQRPSRSWISSRDATSFSAFESTCSERSNAATASPRRPSFFRYPIPDWATADATAWEVARSREAVIRPLTELSSLTIERVEHAAQALALSRSLVYRLVARYRRRPQTSSLLPRIRGRARRVRRLDPTLESVIQTALDTIYLTEQRPRMADLRALATQCRQQQRRAPSYRTVKRRVDALDRKLIVARRWTSTTFQRRGRRIRRELLMCCLRSPRSLRLT
jgi:hypothetical protein